MSQPSMSRLEAWTLARIVSGYAFDDLPVGLSGRIALIAMQLVQIGYKDREHLLRRNISATDWRFIQSIDTESGQPLPEMAEDSQWVIIHASELSSLKPVTWIVPGEIPENGLTVIYGESGAGKSFVALDYAMRVSQQRRVMYVPTEGEQGYRKRVAAWCQFHGKTERELDLFFVLGSISLFEQDIFEKLLNDLSQVKPALTIIDTLGMASVGMDENSARDMLTVVRACRRITRAGSAVVLVHHTNKGGFHERGSGHLRNSADSMIRVSPLDEIIAVECAKTKDEAPFDTKYLAWVDVNVEGVGSSRVTIAADKVIQNPEYLSPNQKKILEIMALEVNRDGVSTREIEAQTGISLGTVVRTLSNLHKKHLVEKPNGSYRISNKGCTTIGADPLDPQVIHTDDRKTADDPRDPRDPRESRAKQNGMSGSRGSRGSSREKVDQSGSVGGSGGSETAPMPVVQDAQRKTASTYYQGGY